MASSAPSVRNSLNSMNKAQDKPLMFGSLSLFIKELSHICLKDHYQMFCIIFHLQLLVA